MLCFYAVVEQIIIIIWREAEYFSGLSCKLSVYETVYESFLFVEYCVWKSGWEDTMIGSFIIHEHL